MITIIAFKNYIYSYRYDDRQRVIEKKVPGKGWEHIVYNVLDQIVLTQDSIQRSNNQWLFTKYDEIGRNVITGVLSSSSSRSTWQSNFDGQTYNWETRDNANSSTSGTGYTNNSLPTSAIASYHTLSYFDDYSFYGNSFSPGITVSSNTKGLPTGNQVNIIGTGSSILSTTYYDTDGRAMRTIAGNLLGGTDTVTNSYSFAGELNTSTRTHIANSTSTAIGSSYTYDHVGREISTTNKINAQAEVVLNKLEYNEIGQLKKKSLHSTDGGANFMQNSTYSYNEQGWIKNTNSSEFSMQLNYEDGSTPQYNGNISNQYYNNAGTTDVFTYNYDKLNRLTSGTTPNYGETLTYDNMGNILSLSRDGGTAGTYNYLGNQLTSISGGPLATGSYNYDVNGNATTDGRLGATIAYNILNLPSSFSKSGMNVAFTYDATGQKLRKVNSIAGITTDYVDGIQYTNGAIDFIQTDEGRALNNSGTYSYQYDLKDHLGNVRHSFDIYAGAIRKLQNDDYYAFGLRHPVTGGTNNYLYNGKELHDELGQYNYGARFYDPIVSRWNSVDLMAGISPSESPYAFVGNSPINFVDEGGMFRISAEFARMYPTLARMLKYYLPKLNDNPVVKAAFVRTTGMSGAFFDQAVKYGSGPWIVPAVYHSDDNIHNPNDPAYKSGSGYEPDWPGAEENLYISSQKLDALERAFKAALKSRKADELGFQMFFVNMHIMHEFAHYGYFKKNGLKKSREYGRSNESGADFETAAFEKFSYKSNVDASMDEDAMRKYYKSNMTSTKMFGMSLFPTFLGISNNMDYLRNFPAPIPNDNSASGKDPHINPPKPHKH